MKKPGLVAALTGYFKGVSFPATISPSNKTTLPPADEEKNDGRPALTPSNAIVKPGGWKTMPFIIGNETFERVASFGLTANLAVYLVKNYHLHQVTAVNLINIWNGTANFAPLIGAFVADTYMGKFKTLAYACIATFLGMVVMTLTAAIHGLQPPRCNDQALMLGQCMGPSRGQMGVLILSLVLLTLGSAGVRPCNLPFGMDQFDRTTDAGRKGTNSFFNWYYTTNTAAVMVAITVVVYLQDSVSWALGFGVPTALMFIAIVLFFVGTRLYIYVDPEGSSITGIVQVFVAAYRKRSLLLPSPAEQELSLYDPPLINTTGDTIIKLPLTQQFSFLNKAAIKLEGDLDAIGGSLARPWSLCSVQRVEEAKCLLRIFPIWVSGITCFVAISQIWTFSVLQSLTMDRGLGHKFQIPPGSLTAFSLLAIVLFLPIYDRMIVPAVSRMTKLQGGITLLQRMGVGIVISVLSMVVAGAVEKKRRQSALLHGGYMSGMSALWVAPQLALVGISEAFNAVGQIEFYNQEFPDQMRSLATSLFWVSISGGNYLSSVVVTLVQKNSGRHGMPNWLDNNINAGRVDYFYYLLAVMGAVNFLYFLAAAHFYQYKGAKTGSARLFREEQEEDEEKSSVGGEVSLLVVGPLERKHHD